LKHASFVSPNKFTPMVLKVRILREILSMGRHFRLQQKPQEHHPIHLLDSIQLIQLQCKGQAITRVQVLLCPNYRFKVTSLMLTEHRKVIREWIEPPWATNAETKLTLIHGRMSKKQRKL